MKDKRQNNTTTKTKQTNKPSITLETSQQDTKIIKIKTKRQINLD